METGLKAARHPHLHCPSYPHDRLRHVVAVGDGDVGAGAGTWRGRAAWASPCVPVIASVARPAAATAAQPLAGGQRRTACSAETALRPMTSQHSCGARPMRARLARRDSGAVARGTQTARAVRRVLYCAPAQPLDAAGAVSSGYHELLHLHTCSSHSFMGRDSSTDISFSCRHCSTM